MRASVAANRQSQLPSVSSAAAVANLGEKKKEFEAVAALDRASAQFLKRTEDLGDDFDVMADAGIVHGQVLQQWPDMLRVLTLFLSQREQRAEEEDASAPTTGERLVRVPTAALPDAIPRIDIHFPITVPCTLLGRSALH